MRWPLGAMAVSVMAAGAAGAFAGQPHALPDLIVKRVRVSPSSAVVGDRLAIHARVSNVGAWRAGRSTVGYYLAPPGAGARPKVRLGGGPRGRLERGGSSGGGLSLAVPATAAGASWRVVACADDLHRVRERRERNNCTASHEVVKVAAATGTTGPPTTQTDPPPKGSPGPAEPPADTAAPAVTVADPVPGSRTALMTLAGAVGTAPGDASSVSIDIYAGSSATGTPVQSPAATVSGDGWSAAAVPLDPGTYTIRATQDDKAGNHGRATSTFTVPVTLLAAGDIAACGSTGDDATAALLGLRSGTIAALGDNAYQSGTATEFQDCYDPSWGPFKPRTLPTPGNHEYLTAGAAGYFGYYGAAAGDPAKGYYSYDLGKWHIVVLNTNSNCADVACSTGSTQELWLRADLLAHATTKCTLAYFHHPRFSSYLGPNSTMQPLWQALSDGGADVIVNGHAHDYERFAPQTPTGAADASTGIREFIAGTGGASHHAFGTTFATNSEAHEGDAFGILQLTLDDAGYSWQFVPEAGQTFTDAGSASCH
ncbi:MAG: hypothetical protein QOK25_835 [Thermoleophilaceae bacterium]|nr:hypothetical protein [Thermoleophilaceae bacterium]